MVINLLIFIISLYAITKGSTMATKYSVKLAENFRISKFLVGFMIVAIISILPETFVAINASLENIPSFGLGTLFGSNVADLTLVFAPRLFLTISQKVKIGGEGGIRTPESFDTLLAFQASALDHYATSPNFFVKKAFHNARL